MLKIEFRATSKLDSRYVRYLGEVEKSNYFPCAKYIGEIAESRFLFTYFGIIDDDRHTCTVNVTQDESQELESVLGKELSRYDRSMFHETPDNPRLRFNNSLYKYDRNFRFLEYNYKYKECMRLLHRCVEDINKGVRFDWNKDTLEIIFSW